MTTDSPPRPPTEPLALTPLPPLPSGLVWHVHALHVGVEARADGTRLCVTVAWELLDQEYVVIALEAVDGAPDADVLGNHAHQLLGRFDTEADSKAAAEDFAKTWRAGGSSDACDCGPISDGPGQP